MGKIPRATMTRSYVRRLKMVQAAVKKIEKQIVLVENEGSRQNCYVCAIPLQSEAVQRRQ